MKRSLCFAFVRFTGVDMLNFYILPLVKNYIKLIHAEYCHQSNGKNITNKQKIWLAFSLSMMLLTNSINWNRFERFSLGSYKAKALSFMLHHANIPFELLFECGLRVLFKLFQITEGHIVADDTDHPRAKVTKTISFVFKSFNKKTGGYFNCQNLVFLVFVTNKITIPIGFKFYTPCPKIQKWKKSDKDIRKFNRDLPKDCEIKKLKREKMPQRSDDHPSRMQIFRSLLSKFKKNFKDIQILSCSFDAAYASDENIRATEKLISNTLLISELACSINVSDKRRTCSIEKYFKAVPTRKEEILIRGFEKQEVEIKHARLYVPAHKRKLNIIALRYQGEENFRFIFTPQLSYRPKDVVQIFTYRWLVEVFFFDWKCYEGFGQAAMQQNDAGSLCGVNMSLLLDQCLLTHPEQIRRIENNLPACTVGSLREKINIEQHLEHIRALLLSENPSERIKTYAENIEQCFIFRDSKKHMSGRTFPEFKPDPKLEKKFSQSPSSA